MSPFELVRKWLEGFNLNTAASGALASILLAVLVLVVSLIAFFISRRIVDRVVHRIFKRTRVAWDDLIEESRFFIRLTLLVPAIIIHLTVPLILA